MAFRRKRGKNPKADSEWREVCHTTKDVWYNYFMNTVESGKIPRTLEVDIDAFEVHYRDVQVYVHNNLLPHHRNFRKLTGDNFLEDWYRETCINDERQNRKSGDQEEPNFFPKSRVELSVEPTQAEVSSVVVSNPVKVSLHCLVVDNVETLDDVVQPQMSSPKYVPLPN
jgi:hypothetical protein